MKTITVEDLTWKTLTEMKLEWGKTNLNQVIEKLIVENTEKFDLKKVK